MPRVPGSNPPSGHDALSRRGAACYVLALMAVSAHFAVAYATSTTPFLDVGAYTAGDEALPYQYRALTSWLLALLVRLPWLDAIAQTQPPPFERAEALASTLLSLVAVAVATDATRRTIRHLVGDAARAAALAFVLPMSLYVSYVALASTYRFSFPYDLPTVAAFAVCLFALVTERPVLFAGAFMVAAVSRETAVFLIPVLLLYHLPRTRAQAVRRAAQALGLAVMWLGVRAGLGWIYANNDAAPGAVDGGWFVVWASANAVFWATPKYWPGLLSAIGFLWLPIVAGWTYIRHPPLARTLWITLPWLVGMSIVARVTEVRVFGELTTLFSVVTALIVSNYFSDVVEPPSPAARPS